MEGGEIQNQRGIAGRREGGHSTNTIAAGGGGGREQEGGGGGSIPPQRSPPGPVSGPLAWARAVSRVAVTSVFAATSDSASVPALM